jgi:AcrR family transcriptional regulator
VTEYDLPVIYYDRTVMSAHLQPKPGTPNLWQSQKRKSIQEAVIRLMCREGLAAVTMERVAQEVGIAKGTVYLHYRDKQELLDTVRESALAPMVSRLDEALAGNVPADRKLEAFSSRYLAYFDERRDLFRILLYERASSRVYGSRFQSERYRHMQSSLAVVIAAGIEDGVFRAVDPQKTAAMFLDANFGVVNQRLLTEDGTAVGDDAALVSDIFLTGIRISPSTPRTVERRIAS